MIASHLAPNLVWALAGVFAVLILASLLVFGLGRRVPRLGTPELAARLRSWWVMILLFSGAILLSRTAALCFLGIVSFLALKEYLSLIPTRRVDRQVLLWVYLAVPVQYYWVATGWYGMFVIFIPVYMFLLLPVPMLLRGETRGFLKALGTLNWGLMATVFSLSHAAYLLVLPDAGNPAGGGAGLLLYLLILTEANDVAQYVWGKSLGRAKVVPRVSPNKSWAGLLGGIATTMAIGAALAPFLTPFGWEAALGISFLLGLAGFVGDITISAIKRDLGVKDSGALLPGHGGVLDRLDSLTYTAPLFFHFTRYFFF